MLPGYVLYCGWLWVLEYMQYMATARAGWQQRNNLDQALNTPMA